MRVVFFIKYYDGFISSLEKKLATQQNLDYAESLDFVTKESANIFAPFVEELKKLGHEAELLIPNFECLQRKWARENNIEFSSDWLFALPKLQVENLKPDVLFMNSNFEYYGSYLASIKIHSKKVCAWISCPFDEGLDLKGVDHIFTLFEPHYNFFQSKKIPSTLTQGAFDTSVLSSPPLARTIDFSFIGGIGGYHKEREKYLKRLVKQTPIQLWGYGFESNHPVKNIAKQIKSGFAYRKAFQGAAWGKDMLTILRQSKVTFNCHGDIAKDHAVNMRLFEATGCGALLMTEKTDNLKKFFIPEKEVVTYSSIEEAIEKALYYIQHNEERELIAKAGQHRTIKEHGYEHLAKKYVSIFTELLNE